MDRRAIDDLKARVGILDYLRQHNREPRRHTAGGQVAGLCPLHSESRPSFWIHTRKNVFYCHGCGRGGDVIRFLEF
jgi:DNA primase